MAAEPRNCQWHAGATVALAAIPDPEQDPLLLCPNQWQKLKAATVAKKHA